MNEHRTPEQAEALKQAKSWEAASAVCCISSVVLLVAGGPLSKYLPLQIGISDEMLRAAFILLPIVWIGVMAYCSSRANEQRCVASGQRHWRQQRKELAEELARVEAYLNMKKR